jgi:hypothetical protein
VTLALAIVLTVLTHVAFVGSRMTIALYGIKLGATPFTVGVLMALYAFLPMLLAVYAGRQTDRIGARRPMLYSSLGLVASVALPGLWPSLAALHLAAMAIGTSFLFYHVALNNVIGQLGTPADRTVNFSPPSSCSRHFPRSPCCCSTSGAAACRARRTRSTRARSGTSRTCCASRNCAAPSSPARCWRWAGTSTPS